MNYTLFKYLFSAFEDEKIGERLLVFRKKVYIRGENDEIYIGKG